MEIVIWKIRDCRKFSEFIRLVQCAYLGKKYAFFAFYPRKLHFYKKITLPVEADELPIRRHLAQAGTSIARENKVFADQKS